MKQLKFLIPFLFIGLCFSSCTEDDDDTINDHYLVIWSDFSGPPISVYIDGDYSGKITSYYVNETPECGASGCVTIKVYPDLVDSYEVYAEEEGTNRVWNTYATVNESIECRNLKLTN